jgi:hypothetical protein
MKRDGLDVGEWNFPAASVLDTALNPPPSIRRNDVVDAVPDAGDPPAA